MNVERFFKIFSKPDDIWSAAERGDIEAIKKFVAQGANVNSKQDEEGWRPLHCAARAGHLETVKELVRLGAKISVRESGGYTPFHAAFWDNANVKTALIDFFLGAGADINKNVKGGGTVLSLAALGGNEVVVRHLLARGADPNAATDTMLSAASGKNVKVVEILLQAGAKVNAEPRQDSALGSAALYGQIEIVRLLLANGANPNHRDNSNETALMSAVMSKKIAVVQLLLEARADVNVKSFDDRTALDRAEWQKLHKIATLLKTAGAKRGSEIVGSGIKDNPTTSWELLHGTILGATLEPWPAAAGQIKLVVDVTQDDYSNSFSGIVNYRVTRTEENSEEWLPFPDGEEDEDGNVLYSATINLVKGANIIQFRIRGKRDKDFIYPDCWPVEVR